MPVRRMIISRDNGNLNTYFSLDKGQVIDLFYFCTIGKKKNDEAQTYPVYVDGTDEIVYVEESEISKYKSGKIPLKELPIDVV